MKADIVVLTYGNAELSNACFKSLRKYTTGYRLIWLDNGSGEQAVDSMYAEAMSCNDTVPIWLSENVGFVKGTNIALKYLLEVDQTDADYIVLLNNDVEVAPGWLDRMHRVFLRNEKLAAVGPVTSECASWQSFLNIPQVLPSFQTPDGFVNFDTKDRAISLDYAYGDLSGKCNMLAFFCTVFKADVFRKIGYLDEDFGVGYGDDDDFCKRIRDAKMELAVSYGTYVFHNHQSTFKLLYSDSEIRDMKKERHETYRKKHGEDAKV